MKLKSTAVALMLFTTLPAMSVMAANDELQLSARIGSGSLHIKPNVLTDRLPDDVDTTTFGINLGYVTPIGVLVEGGYLTNANHDNSWFDDNDELHYRLSEYTLAVGYQLETRRGFRVIPKIGRTRYNLYSRDLPFLEANPDHYNNLRGYENFWELGLQKTLGKYTALGLTYKDNNFDFGSARSLALTVTISM